MSALPIRTSDGLKGCAARTGKPALALDPATRAQPRAMVLFRSGPVRSDISIREKLRLFYRALTAGANLIDDGATLL
jgi:hypothetical protein